MIYYTDADESILVGIYSARKSEANIAKAVGNLLSYDMVQAESDEFEEIGEFEHDTVIISSADFVEDILELLDKDIKVYIV
jgi:hypothetical protein